MSRREKPHQSALRESNIKKHLSPSQPAPKKQARVSTDAAPLESSQDDLKFSQSPSIPSNRHTQRPESPLNEDDAPSLSASSRDHFASVASSSQHVVNQPMDHKRSEDMGSVGVTSASRQSSGLAGTIEVSDGGTKRIKKSWRRECMDNARFFVSSGLAMAVPITLMIIYSSITLHYNRVDYTWIQDNMDLLDALDACSIDLMNERGRSASYTATGGIAQWEQLQAYRRKTDEECKWLVHALSERRTSEPEVFQKHFDDLNENLRRLVVIRNEVEQRSTNGIAHREFYTEKIDSFHVLFTVVELRIKRSLEVLKDLRLALALLNHAEAAIASGNMIAYLQGAPEDVVRDEFVEEYAKAKATVSLLEELELKEFNVNVEGDPRWIAMWSLLGEMRTTTGYRRIQQNPEQWWTTLSNGTVLLEQFNHHLLDELHKAKELLNAVRDDIIKMLAGILLCLVAAIGLGFHQRRLRDEMDQQLVKIRISQKAISAFVPRFFLNTMGYTDITQVEAGASTETALAMLFADIRQFTTVAEGMSNIELFDWVQNYFKNMTQIVESNRGNVNQFIGDALFAVFKSAQDAILCGVAMQASTQKLNIDSHIGSRLTVPVHIGVGIHFDLVALGILGDSSRHTCTMIAASVNMASRLEGLTKQLGCLILISDNAMNQVTDQEDILRIRNLGSAVMKGSDEPMRIHEVFMADSLDLQKYKLESREEFHHFVNLVFASPPCRDRVRDELSRSTSYDHSPHFKSPHELGFATSNSRSNNYASATLFAPTSDEGTVRSDFQNDAHSEPTTRGTVRVPLASVPSATAKLAVPPLGVNGIPQNSTNNGIPHTTNNDDDDRDKEEERDEKTQEPAEFSPPKSPVRPRSPAPERVKAMLDDVAVMKTPRQKEIHFIMHSRDAAISRSGGNVGENSDFGLLSGLTSFNKPSAGDEDGISAGVATELFLRRQSPDSPILATFLQLRDMAEKYNVVDEPLMALLKFHEGKAMRFQKK